MDHGTLTLKNYTLGSLVEFLSVPLTNTVARTRNKFILKLSDRIKFLEDHRMELLKQYGDLKDGEFQFDQNGHYKLLDKETFTKEYSSMMEDTLALPCIAEDLPIFNTIFSVLQTLETGLDVEKTKHYDEIMTAFETWKTEEQAKATA